MWDAIVVFIKLRPVVEEFYQKQQSLWQDYWNKITDFNQKPPLRNTARSLPNLTTIYRRMTGLSYRYTTNFLSRSIMLPNVSREGEAVLVTVLYGR